eukprot:Em0015g906a
MNPAKSSEEESIAQKFSFAVTARDPLPRRAAVDFVGPAPISPGSKDPAELPLPLIYASPPLPATAHSVPIATPFPASAPACTTAPLVLKFSPTNKKSIFASSIGSSIPIGAECPAGTGRRFSLQHIGLSETETKRIGEVVHAMPPVTPQTTLLPRSSVPRASRSRNRDHANGTPYSRGNFPFQNAISSSSSSKSRAGQQEMCSLLADKRFSAASSRDVIYTESVTVSDILVARIIAFYHMMNMMCKINAVRSAVQKLRAYENKVKWYEMVTGAQNEQELPSDLNEALNLSYAPDKLPDSYAYSVTSAQKQMLLAVVLTGDAIESQPDKKLTKATTEEGSDGQLLLKMSVMTV